MSCEHTSQLRAQFVAEGSNGRKLVVRIRKNEIYEGENRKQKPFKGDDVKDTYVTPWQMGYEMETLSVQKIIIL